MKKLIDVLAVLGFGLYVVAALTLEAHVVQSLVTCLIGTVLMIPHLRLTYLKDTGR